MSCAQEVIAAVLQQRSTRDLSLPTAVATTAKCALAFAQFTLVTYDPFIAVPNLLGLCSGVVQLGLFACLGMPREVPPKNKAS